MITLEKFMRRVDLMAQYSHALTVSPAMLASLPSEDCNEMMEVIKIAEKNYPDETDEVKCPAHAPATRAYWIGAVAVIHAVNIAQGQHEYELDESEIFDHDNLLAMTDVIVNQLIEDDENQPTNH